jgi:excisionase family DNA binding protein
MSVHTTAPVLESIIQTCARYSICRSYLYRLIGAGHIRAVKVGTRTKIDIASADAYFAALPVARIKPDKRSKSAPAAVPPSQAGEAA